MTADTAAKDDVEKPWTPDAEIALDLWVTTTRGTVRANAMSVSQNETILVGDVHTAAERFETAQSVYTKRSDWAKWVGFFALGIFVPNLITLLNAANADKSTIWWMVGPVVVGVALLTYSYVRDFGRKRAAAKR